MALHTFCVLADAFGVFGSLPQPCSGARRWMTACKKYMSHDRYLAHSAFLSPLRAIVASTSEHSVLYQIGKQQKRAKLNWEVDLWTQFQTFSTALLLFRFFRLFFDHRNLLCAHHNLIAKNGLFWMYASSQVHRWCQKRVKYINSIHCFCPSFRRANTFSVSRSEHKFNNLIQLKVEMRNYYRHVMHVRRCFCSFVCVVLMILVLALIHERNRAQGGRGWDRWMKTQIS